MKINNPTKFFINSSSDSSAAYRATLMSRGDVIRKFAVQDSEIESNWHLVENSDDSWVKFSFDGGISYPLKFRYKNTLLMKFFKEGKPEIGTELEFDFGEYSSIDYDSIKNGRISVYAMSADGYLTHLPCYRYKFTDSQVLDIILTMDVPDDTVKSMVLVELDGHSAMAMAVPTPVFSSFVSFTPMSYSSELGNYGVLGSDNTEIILTTNLDNVGKLSLKVQSASSSASGYVMLKFACGSSTPFIQAIPVNETLTWQEIDLLEKMTGTLTISRLINDEGDTLEGDCIIDNIKIEVFS